MIIFTHEHHIVVVLISPLCVMVFIIYLFIFGFLLLCFCFLLVVSGKLKCHPSPIHRPDRDRKLSQPPPSSFYHLSTLQ